MAACNGSSRADDGQLFSGAKTVRGFWLTASDGTNPATALFYDNDSGASGDVLMELAAPATGPTAVVMFPDDHPRAANVGCYVDVTSSGACRAGVIYD